MGPHRAVAELRRAVRTALVDAAGSAGTGTVIVACSGGADSLALAAATAFEAPRAGIRAALVTIDHGLQPGSDRQAQRVATIGYELGFDPVEIVPVAVASGPGAGGPEAAARAARYAALDAAAAALDAAVLLGHTLDDQAETVLLGLGRGSGPRSVAGMRTVDGRYLRPLLGVRRATTEAACAALGLVPWADPHNDDPAYQRVRLRREVLPLLDDVLQGGVAAALARTATLLRDDLDALDDLAAGHEGEVQIAALAALPRAVRTRVLRAAAQQVAGAELDAIHVTALDELVTDWHGQGPLQLPGGLRADRASGRLVLYREREPIAPSDERRQRP